MSTFDEDLFRKGLEQRKATLGAWIGGMRLKTMPLAIAPVALGTATA